jgi:hypothetical protein
MSMEHTHIAKIIAWKLDENTNSVPAKYGCTGCDKQFDERPPSVVFNAPHTHASYVDGCFACKVTTLQLDPGDASSNKAMSKKKWDNELDAYANARAQGIQPSGTSMKQVVEAEKASDTLGTAYNGEKMMPANKITKAHAQVMKEVGI